MLRISTGQVMRHQLAEVFVWTLLTRCKVNQHSSQTAERRMSDKIMTLNGKIGKETIHSNIANSNVQYGTIRCERVDGFIVLTFIDVKTKNGVSAGSDVLVGELESNYIPNSYIAAFGEGASGGVNHLVRLTINTSGQVRMGNYGSSTTNFYANGILIYPLN